MPPTRTRDATSSAVRPVRTATASRSGSSGRDARQSSERPARQGHDGGRARIARALGQRAVEVGHDEQRAGPRSPDRPIAPMSRVGQDVTSTPRQEGRQVDRPATGAGPTNGGAGWPTRTATAAALGVTEAAADGLGARGDRRRRRRSARRDRDARVGADGGGGSGANARIPPSSSPATSDPDHEAGDDRQAWPSYRAEGTSTSGRRRLEGSTATMPLPWPTSGSGSARGSCPAILTALGVTFLAVGLLSFTDPVAAVPLATRIAQPHGHGRTRPPLPLITLPPLGRVGRRRPSRRSRPTGSPTRIRIAALKIDLPVIAPTTGYPACNVAMYYDDPGSASRAKARRSTSTRHARTGMFLPLLTAPRCRTARR